MTRLSKDQLQEQSYGGIHSSGPSGFNSKAQYRRRCLPSVFVTWAILRQHQLMCLSRDTMDAKSHCSLLVKTSHILVTFVSCLSCSFQNLPLASQPILITFIYLFICLASVPHLSPLPIDPTLHFVPDCISHSHHLLHVPCIYLFIIQVTYRFHYIRSLS